MTRSFTSGNENLAIRQFQMMRDVFMISSSCDVFKASIEPSGLKGVEQLTQVDVRGHDHGWINLGMRGV